MKEIQRNYYLQKLIDRRGVNLIKIITGIRRCGKSYLLDPIFRNYLLENGVPGDHIIKINLELAENTKLRNSDELLKYVKSRIVDDGQYYLLLDEIQLVPEFESVLSSFLYTSNLDTYVTGSNSKFLSSDVITEFRGRGDNIHMYPLSFGEFYDACGGNKDAAWRQYCKYGGLPLTLEYRDDAGKVDYLNMQMGNVYLNDVVERYGIRNERELETLAEIVASGIGSLTNPYKLEKSFKSKVNVDLSHRKITGYLDRLEDAFIIEKAKRYSVKGKHYIDTPMKYYFTDMGIRNAFLGFRQVGDEGHVMENVIYNELRRRGCQVDVGVVEVREGDARKQLEVDFVVNKNDARYYIQSALTIGDFEKRMQESRSLEKIDDHFTKIIVTRDDIYPGHEFSGIATIGLWDFLLNEDILEQYK